MSECQKGGEFFTPTSVVRFIVEVFEPYAGKIFDPACGSGGMFVQSAKFIQVANHDLTDIYVCGQEDMGETVRLAKMNLLVNNIRGETTEISSYKNAPCKSFNKFDFVRANPPFNVESVKATGKRCGMKLKRSYVHLYPSPHMADLAFQKKWCGVRHFYTLAEFGVRVAAYEDPLREEVFT